MTPEEKRAKNRSYYLKNKAAIIAQHLEYRKTPKGKMITGTAAKRWKINNPEKLLEQRRRYEKSEKRKAYLEANRAARLDQMKIRNARPHYAEKRGVYRAAHADDARDRTSNWRRLNPDGWNQWRRSNPAAARIIEAKKFHKRRALKKSACDGVDLNATNRKIEEIKSAASMPCRWCGTPTIPERRHVDHIIPLNKGGKHCADNLCCACVRCNCAKRDKLPQEFLAMVRAKATHHRKERSAKREGRS